MAGQSSRIALDKRQLLLLAVAVVALYVVIPQIGNFRHSLTLLPGANRSNLLTGAGFIALTYIAAAGTYYWLALRAIRYGRTLLVQIAGTFMNRLLPAGIGGIGVNYAYLKKAHHSNAQAASVVAVNNGLGFAGHMLLLAIVLPLYGTHLPHLQLWHFKHPIFIVIVSLVLMASLMILYKRFETAVRRSVRDFTNQLVVYRHRPGHFLIALFCSMSLTLCNVLCFWLCITAVQSGVSFVTALIVFSFGIALGTATPTPGGLGGVEAGLLAGLVAYHVHSETALAAVLLFRLLSFWLPLVIGAPAFLLARKRQYF
jgi:uncharacterized protein (TIRG00374 family)